jgi:hypothetical protein
MYDEILGYFEEDKKQCSFEKTYYWIDRFIYLTFFGKTEEGYKKGLSILRELCANKAHWNTVMREYLHKNMSSYWDKSKLCLLEIYINNEPGVEYDTEEGDFSFAFSDGEQGICAVWVNGTLADGPIDIWEDLYWRGAQIDGLLSGEIEKIE